MYILFIKKHTFLKIRILLIHFKLNKHFHCSREGVKKRKIQYLISQTTMMQQLTAILN